MRLKVVRVASLSTLLAVVGGTAWWLSLPQPTELEEPIRPAGSSLSRITLTEFNAMGEQIWEVGAQRAEYNQTTRTTDAYELTGRFFRNGKPIMEASAAIGSVSQSERAIILRGQAKVIALQENVVVTSEKLTWQSDQDLLTATEQVKVAKPDRQITITGKALKAKPSINQFRVEQDVVALSVNPPLRLVGAVFIWDANRDTVTSPFAFGGRQTVSDLRLRANRGVWSIPNQLLTLVGDVRARAPKLDLQIDTSELSWQIQNQAIVLPKNLKAISVNRGIVVTAAQGKVDLDKGNVQIRGEVLAKAAANSSQLRAETAEWLIEQQQITAQGNVSYQQLEPNLQVNGNQAIANLESQTVTVNGSGAVVTKIAVP